jgi:hypothetical protein
MRANLFARHTPFIALTGNPRSGEPLAPARSRFTAFFPSANHPLIADRPIHKSPDPSFGSTALPPRHRSKLPPAKPPTLPESVKSVQSVVNNSPPSPPTLFDKSALFTILDV